MDRCYNCESYKVTWYCKCGCCDEILRACDKCGEDLPHASVDMNSINKEKYV